MTTVIENVILIPGGGVPVQEKVDVVVDAEGRVAKITRASSTATSLPEASPKAVPDLFLLPFAVDTHLDNMTERRKPRATVWLDQATVLNTLDAECAAAGLGVVCIAARCENAPGKGVFVDDAIHIAQLVEKQADSLACDWRIHARVEVTDDVAVDALEKILEVSTRVAVISVMEHSAEKNRFASLDEHRKFYAEDWGVSLAEVDAMMADKAAGSAGRQRRREAVAALAKARGIPLASHDDRNAEDVVAGFELGARIAEFPLSFDAARKAIELGMTTVLGAPNALRGKSTSSHSILVSDAVEQGVCAALCTDYLPAAIVSGMMKLADSDHGQLADLVDLISLNPARAIGIPVGEIKVGTPLNATLGTWDGDCFQALQLWRGGKKTFSRGDA